MKILYIEDNPLDVDLLLREFSRSAAQIQVECATTYREALQKIDTCTPDHPNYDLILTDMRLPDGSGLQVMPYLRERGVDIAVIVLTGSGSDETLVTALKTGADDYLVKRDDYLKRLPKVIETVLQRFRVEVTRRSKPLHVLYAEHNMAEMEFMRSYFARTAPHIKLKIVANAADALEELPRSVEDVGTGQTRWDVFMFNYWLPDMDGLELLKELLQTRGLNLPVVMVAGQGEEEIALQALRMGAMDYVVKSDGYLNKLPVILENAFNRVELAREQAALRRSEVYFQRLSRVVQQTADIVIITDKKGIIEYVNPAFEACTGYSQQEVVGQNTRILKSGLHDKAFYADMWNQILAGNIFNGLMVNRRQDGSLYYEEKTITPLRDDKGNLTHFVSTSRDVTRKIEAEEALKQEKVFSDTVIDNQPGIFYVLNRSGKYIRWNRAQQELLGLSYKKMESTGIYSFIHKEDKDLVRQKIREVFDQGHAEAELRLMATGGDIRQFYMTVSRMDIGAESYAVGTGVDITERKKREQELEAITGVSAALRRANSHAGMLPVILEQMASLFKTENVAIFSRDPQRDIITIDQTQGILLSALKDLFTIENGLVEQVVKTGQMYVNNAVQNDAILSAVDGFGEMVGFAVAPLLSQGLVIGGLVLARKSRILEDELRLLGAIADMVANAIQRTTLYEQTERSRRQMAVVGEAGRVLSELLDLKKIFLHLGDAVFRMLPGVDNVFVSMFDAENKQFHCVYARASDDQNLDPSILPPVPLEPPGRGTQSEVVHTRRPVILHNLRERLKKVKFYVEVGTPGDVTQSGVYVPMLSQGQVVGVVQAQSIRPNVFNEADVEALSLIANTAAVAVENTRLFKDLEQSNLDLELAYDATIEGLSRALDLRDRETEDHTQRVTRLTLELAQALGIGDAQLVHIRRGALLHDIGKLGVPDGILLKRGPLSAEEWVIMKMHPQYAYDMLLPIDYLGPALNIPYYHHERWDGSGYPHSLQGKDIPLEARIFAIIDVWDALTSDRVYRPAWTKERSLAHILSETGKHFDPEIVEAFVRTFQDTVLAADSAPGNLSPAIP